MEPLFIFIIVISTLLAVVFKWVLYKKIQGWIDQDLIKGLAEGDAQKLAYLQQEYQRLLAEKRKRNDYREQLTTLAKQFEQTR